MDSKVNTAKADREDIFSQNCEFELPLVFAAAHGDVAWVNELLERGEDANQCETDGHTPLIAVCQTSKCEAEDRKMIVRLLLMQSSNPLQLDVATNKGLTPLKAAVWQQDADLVSLLLQHGCDVNFCGEASSVTPLMYAVVHGDDNYPVVKVLLEAGALVNLQDSEGWSALMLAARADGLAVAHELVRRAAQPSLQALGQYSGWTALMFAARAGSAEMCKLLLGTLMAESNFSSNSSGGRASSSLEDPGGLGRAFAAACVRGHLGVVKVLLAAGFLGMHAVCDEIASGRALNAAATHGHVDIVTELLAASLGWAETLGVGIDAKDAQGWTALLAACEYGHQECAELLVDSGADIHVADQHGCSPLMAAAAHNHAEIVGILLDAGADANYIDDDGWTALMVASESGGAHSVKVLLNNGACHGIKNRNGQDAIQLATKLGNLSVLNEFLRFNRGENEDDEDNLLDVLEDDCANPTEKPRSSEF